MHQTHSPEDYPQFLVWLKCNTMRISIKKEYKSTVVGFNNSAKPLGERDDLYLLAEMAHKTKSLKKYFSKLPSLKSIQNHKGELFLKSMDNKKQSQNENQPNAGK